MSSAFTLLTLHFNMDTNGERSIKQEKLEVDVRDMKLKEESEGDVDMDTLFTAEASQGKNSGNDTPASVGTPIQKKRESRSPTKVESMSQSPAVKFEDEDIIQGEVELKLRPGKPPILARKKSHKVERRAPPLFFEYEDKTREATGTFSLLPECVYANKQLGTTEHALECDCVEEWGKSTSRDCG